MVRLLLEEMGEQRLAMVSFNPTMVRLLLTAVSNTTNLSIEFQSHNGAIAAVGSDVSSTFRCCFNPTMVRLLHRHSQTTKFPTSVSIPQWCDCCRIQKAHLPLRNAGFNPTMVRLLRRFRRICSSSICSFNPTMVRLLLVGFSKKGNSLKVSIPQWCDCCPHTVLCAVQKTSFNPTMVRLLRKRPLLSAVYLHLVSIPQWCDCCQSVLFSPSPASIRFNPTMVRLLPGLVV